MIYVYGKSGNPICKCPVAIDFRKKIINSQMETYLYPLAKTSVVTCYLYGWKEIWFTLLIIRKDPSLSDFLILTLKLLTGEAERKHVI